MRFITSADADLTAEFKTIQSSADKDVDAEFLPISNNYIASFSF